MIPHAQTPHHRDMARALAEILDQSQYTDTAMMRRMYAFDASPFIHCPEWVLFPKTTGEVTNILKLAHCFSTTVTPRGAGTGLSGGSVPLDNGLCLCTSRMNQILDIDPVSRTALVQPGVVNLDLQTALAPHGLFFPPDPGSQKVATIGGNVANCAGGIQGARYGVTKNYILGLELVLADGSVVTTGRLNASETLGPNPSDIFNGSEGSLAVITKILVHLLPRPQAVRTALAAFPRIDDAARSVSAIIGQGIIPTALELMDQAMLRAVDDFLNIGFPTDAEAVLLLEVDGFEADLDRQLALMTDTCTAHGATDIQKAANAAERDTLWKARRSGNGALGRIRPAYMVHDVTVPRNELPTLLKGLEPIGKKYNLFIAQMAHAGDGNAHPHMLFYPDEEGIQERLHKATEEMFRLALTLNGTITGEHGVGLEKQAFMGLQFSKADLDFMEAVKEGLDPEQRINPGKTFPSVHDIPPRPEPSIPMAQGPSRVIQFMPDNLSIEATGSMPLNELLEIVTPQGAWLPLCPALHGESTLEELVFSGAFGHQALVTGSLKEFIYGMRFTPHNAARPVSTGGHTAKNVAGTDFTRLLWRSQGRLGRINTLTLKLLPLPEAQRLIISQYPDLDQARQAAARLFALPVGLCTLKARVRPGEPVELIAGLLGSQTLVDLHTTEITTAITQDGEAAVMGILDSPKNHGEYWNSRRHRKGDLLLAHGRGCRARLFQPLALPPGVWADIDFGFPHMEIHGTAALSTQEEKMLIHHLNSSPGFFAAPPEQVDDSPIFKHLQAVMTREGNKS